MAAVQNSQSLCNYTSYKIIGVVVVILAVASAALMLYHGWRKEYDHKAFKVAGIVFGCSVVTLIFMTCLRGESREEPQNKTQPNHNKSSSAASAAEVNVHNAQPVIQNDATITVVQLQVPSGNEWIEDFRAWNLQECANAKTDVLKTKAIFLASTFRSGIDFLLTLEGQALELHIISGAQGKALQAVLEKKVDKGPPDYKLVEGVYDYRDFDTAWIDFANADVPGGGWKGTGAAQDECVFFEFLLARLYAYLAEKQGISMRSADNLHPTPWMINVGQRNFVCKQPMCGNNFRNLKPEEFTNNQQNYFEEARVGQTDCMIGIAAIAHPQQYTKNILTYHAEAFRCACLGAKAKGKTSISTGRWGCGVFKNSPQTMFATMMMVAKIEGIKLKFYAIPQREFGMIEAAADAVSKCTSLNELFDFILQSKDPNWKPPQ